MNIDKNNFDRIIKEKSLETGATLNLRIDDYSSWPNDKKSQLEHLLGSPSNRLILVNVGEGTDTPKYQRIAREAYLKKYLEEYRPNQKKVNPAKLDETPVNVKIVIQNVEQKPISEKPKAALQSPRSPR